MNVAAPIPSTERRHARQTATEEKTQDIPTPYMRTREEREGGIRESGWVGEHERASERGRAYIPTPAMRTYERHASRQQFRGDLSVLLNVTGVSPEAERL